MEVIKQQWRIIMKTISSIFKVIVCSCLLFSATTKQVCPIQRETIRKVFQFGAITTCLATLILQNTVTYPTKTKLTLALLSGLGALACELIRYKESCKKNHIRTCNN
jgi:hypothetical protein